MSNNNLFKKTRKQKEASRASRVSTITTWSEVCQKNFFFVYKSWFFGIFKYLLQQKKITRSY